MAQECMEEQAAYVMEAEEQRVTGRGGGCG
jgi:hypothetical protein